MAVLVDRYSIDVEHAALRSRHEGLPISGSLPEQAIVELRMIATGEDIQRVIELLAQATGQWPYGYEGSRHRGRTAPDAGCVALSPLNLPQAESDEMLGEVVE